MSRDVLLLATVVLELVCGDRGATATFRVQSILSGDITRREACQNFTVGVLGGHLLFREFVGTHLTGRRVNEAGNLKLVIGRLLRNVVLDVLAGQILLVILALVQIAGAARPCKLVARNGLIQNLLLNVLRDPIRLHLSALLHLRIRVRHVPAEAALLPVRDGNRAAQNLRIVVLGRLKHVAFLLEVEAGEVLFRIRVAVHLGVPGVVPVLVNLGLVIVVGLSSHGGVAVVSALLLVGEAVH